MARPRANKDPMYAEECRQCLEYFLGEENIVCPECGEEALTVGRADPGGRSGVVQCEGCFKRFLFIDGQMKPMKPKKAKET